MRTILRCYQLKSLLAIFLLLSCYPLHIEAQSLSGFDLDSKTSGASQVPWCGGMQPITGAPLSPVVSTNPCITYNRILLSAILNFGTLRNHLRSYMRERQLEGLRRNLIAGTAFGLSHISRLESQLCDHEQSLQLSQVLLLAEYLVALSNPPVDCQIDCILLRYLLVILGQIELYASVVPEYVAPEFSGFMDLIANVHEGLLSIYNSTCP